MARGDSGITALSLRRLSLFKELQDIYNDATFLGISGNAASATQLQTSHTIDGVSFNGTSDITLPTKIVRLWYQDVETPAESGTYVRHWYSDSTFTTEVTTFDTAKLYINMVDTVGMFYDSTLQDFVDLNAPTLKNTRTINGVSFNGSANITNYTVCETAADVAAKTAPLTGFVKETSASVFVKFTHTTIVGGITLNINNTGATPVTFNGVPVTAGDIVNNIVYHMVYDGTSYCICGTSKIAYSEFEPATEYSAGVHGLVPAPPVASTEKMFLCADGLWKEVHDSAAPLRENSAEYSTGDVVSISKFPWNYQLVCVQGGTTYQDTTPIDEYLNPQEEEEG
jgi:hypothetical protein